MVPAKAEEIITKPNIFNSPTKPYQSSSSKVQVDNTPTFRSAPARFLILPELPKKETVWTSVAKQLPREAQMKFILDYLT